MTQTVLAHTPHGGWKRFHLEPIPDNSQTCLRFRDRQLAVCLCGRKVREWGGGKLLRSEAELERVEAGVCRTCYYVARLRVFP